MAATLSFGEFDFLDYLRVLDNYRSIMVGISPYKDSSFGSLPDGCRKIGALPDDMKKIAFTRAAFEGMRTGEVPLSHVASTREANDLTRLAGALLHVAISSAFPFLEVEIIVHLYGDYELAVYEADYERHKSEFEASGHSLSSGARKSGKQSKFH